MQTTQEQHIILLIEDDANDAFLFKKATSDLAADLSLTTAANGRDAINYCIAAQKQRGLPELIVTDLKMPVLDGFAFLDWVRGHPAYKRVPVLVWSSSFEGDDVARAYAAGARAYLIKPTKFEDLQRMLKAAITFWLTCWTQARRS